MSDDRGKTIGGQEEAEKVFEAEKSGKPFDIQVDGWEERWTSADRKSGTGMCWKTGVCLLLGLCFGMIMTGIIVHHRSMAVDAKVSQVQRELSKEVFRFHVLADSDSDDAQKVKREVRDRVLDYMKSSMPGSKDLVSVNETKEWAKNHLLQIEVLAKDVIREEGYDYGAKAEVSACYFPEKKYGDVIFPEGWYEALRIRLGSAKGHNWWCVLYPNLCFTDAACSVVDEDGKEALKRALTEEEYELVTATSDFKIKCFFGERIFAKDESK